MNSSLGFRPKIFHVWNQVSQGKSDSKKISCCSVNRPFGLQLNITMKSFCLFYYVSKLQNF
jgi:hypothetical protein